MENTATFCFYSSICLWIDFFHVLFHDNIYLFSIEAKVSVRFVLLAICFYSFSLNANDFYHIVHWCPCYFSIFLDYPCTIYSAGHLTGLHCDELLRFSGHYRTQNSTVAFSTFYCRGVFFSLSKYRRLNRMNRRTILHCPTNILLCD